MVPVRAGVSLNQTALPTQPISLPAPDAECSITGQRTVVLPSFIAICIRNMGKHLLKLTWPSKLMLTTPPPSRPIPWTTRSQISSIDSII
ncbi:unnamed protein product [Arabidopsis halleri]